MGNFRLLAPSLRRHNRSRLSETYVARSCRPSHARDLGRSLAFMLYVKDGNGLRLYGVTKEMGPEKDLSFRIRILSYLPRIDIM